LGTDVRLLFVDEDKVSVRREKQMAKIAFVRRDQMRGDEWVMTLVIDDWRVMTTNDDIDER